MTTEFVIVTEECVKRFFYHAVDYVEAKDIARKLVLGNNKPVIIYKRYRRARLGEAVVFDDLTY